MIQETSRAQQEHWRALTREYTHITDEYGTSIDPGILEVVIACNAFGIHTVASCEGHLQHGPAYPWLHIGASGVDDLRAQLHLSLENSHEGLAKSVVPFSDETKRLRLALRQAHAQEEGKLRNALEQFYAQHPCRYDRHLIIAHTLVGECSLFPSGGELQVLRSPSLRQEKLEEYRQEMAAFGAFLKQHFFLTDQGVDPKN